MKCLITDLDGTLYPKSNVKNKNQLSDNIEAVKAWTKSGHLFAVATARGFHHYPVLTKTLGFDCNFIGCNGAQVMLETGESIIKQIPASIFITLCRFVEENQLNVSVATGINDAWVWSSKDRYPIGWNIFKPGAEDTIQVADLDQIDPTQGIERIQIFVQKHEREQLRKSLETLQLEAVITTSDENMLDIGPLNCSKGIAIMELCKRYAIDLDDLITIGDSENDIPMFELAKRSYCIDHASEDVLKKATCIVSSVKEAIEIELKKEAIWKK